MADIRSARQVQAPGNVGTSSSVSRLGAPSRLLPIAVLGAVLLGLAGVAAGSVPTGPASATSAQLAAGTAGTAGTAGRSADLFRPSPEPTNQGRPGGVVEPVAALATLRQPAALVYAPTRLTPAQLAGLGRLSGVTGVLPVDAGTVPVAGQPALVLGVDPSTFRPYTPGPTAASDPLWQAVARGDLAVSFDLSRPGLTLGGPLTVAGYQVRVGARAALGMPTVGAVIAHSWSTVIGLTSGAGALLVAPGADPQALASQVRTVLGAGVQVVAAPASAGQVSQRASTVATGQPRTYQELYRAAATTCPGLSWSVLAAIGQVESDHGRNVGPSSAGALGPMQFLPSTFRAYAVDGNGDGVADIMNPYDSVYTAARMLCADGAGRGGQSLYNAVFAYNHADWYVREVLDLAAQYAARYGN